MGWSSYLEACCTVDSWAVALVVCKVQLRMNWPYLTDFLWKKNSENLTAGDWKTQILYCVVFWSWKRVRFVKWSNLIEIDLWGTGHSYFHYKEQSWPNSLTLVSQVGSRTSHSTTPSHIPFGLVENGILTPIEIHITYLSAGAQLCPGRLTGLEESLVGLRGIGDGMFEAGGPMERKSAHDKRPLQRWSPVKTHAVITWHILGDRLIPWTPRRVHRGILPVTSTKSFTFSPGFSLRVAKLMSKIVFSRKTRWGDGTPRTPWFWTRGMINMMIYMM